MPRIEYRANRAVTASPDYERIAGLPWREWTAGESEDMRHLLTRELRTRRGTKTLRPLQAVAITEAYEVGGLFASMGVGKGKTLCSLLIPTVLEAKRPMLLVKSDLMAKTRMDIREESKHFAVHPNIKLVSYSQISAPSFTTALQDYEPDLIIADEGQCLKNVKTARGKKFMRTMRTAAKAGTRIRFVCMSGTMMRRSLNDYAHLIRLALGTGTPLPLSYKEMQEWAAAIDLGTPEFARPSPGVLLKFLPDDADLSDIDTEEDMARRAYQYRLRTCPGVVVSAGDAGEVNASLTVRERPVETPAKVLDALAELRKTWTTPAGDELQYSLELWAAARQIASGFVYHWDPAPPAPWMAARKAWRLFVREQLGAGIAGIDSPAQVANAYPEHPDLMRWREIRGSFTPNSVGVWLDEYLINHAAEWLAAEKGIVWVEHSEFGLRLSEVSGVRFFAGGKRDNTDILTYKGPMIASIRVHGTGKNLQDRWNHCLVASCPPAGDVWEQLIGRIHRMGIDAWADEVDFEVSLPCQEMRDGMQKALNDARMVFNTKGMSQKLLTADRVITGLT